MKKKTAKRRKSKLKTLPPDALLTLLLLDEYSGGIPVSEAAKILYGRDGLEQRSRIYYMARSLRNQGYSVHCLKGVCYLCGGKPELLLEVAARKERTAMGRVASFVGVCGDTWAALEKNPDPIRESACLNLQEEARMKLMAWAKTLKKRSS